MDPLAHLLGLAVIAAIIGAMGLGLTLVNASAVRLPLFRGPRPLPLVLLVAAPALAWAGFGLYLLGLMAADPTAANLWPLTLMLMAVLWLGWSALSGLGAALLRVILRQD